MAEKERITRPTMGSNELGEETQEEVEGKGMPAGTDTQTRLAALSTKNQHVSNKDKSESKKDVADYPEANDTDE